MSVPCLTGLAVKPPLPVASGGTGATDGANLVPTVPWTAYTPVVTPTGSGAFGSITVSGRYRLLGKTCLVAVSFTVGSTGSATGYPTISLPFKAANQGVSYCGVGVETAVAGKGTTLDVSPNGATGFLRNADSSAPSIAAGASHDISLTYEIA